MMRPRVCDASVANQRNGRRVLVPTLTHIEAYISKRTTLEEQLVARAEYTL